MKLYRLTVFETNGKKLLDETLKADDDESAKELGEQILAEKCLSHKTYRLTSATGKLLLFQS